MWPRSFPLPPMRRTVKRTIKLRSIKDPHTVEFPDGGVTREGEATSQRQALSRVLSKRIDVDGKQMPVFLIESVGDWKFAPGEVMPGGDEFASFEEDVIKREHPEHMIKKWNESRAGFIAKSVESRRQAEAQMEKNQSADVANTITQMVRAVSAKGGARV